MASGGHNRKPALAVVREGNPGKRAIPDSVVLPPTALVEPDWADLLPEAGALVAAKMWAKLAAPLAQSVGLVAEQQEVLIDYCVTWARIVENEKAITREGMLVEGVMGGLNKNPRTTVLNQYRAHMRSLVGELGLSPRAATGIARVESSDDEDPFD